jgi:hypothetical protein
MHTQLPPDGTKATPRALHCQSSWPVSSVLIWILGLICILVFRQIPQTFLPDVEPKIRMSVWAKGVPVVHQDANANIQTKFLEAINLRVSKFLLKRGIDDRRGMIRVESDFIPTVETLCRWGKVNEREWEDFHPSIINNIVGGSWASIYQANYNSWIWLPVENVFKWTTLRLGGNTRALALNESLRLLLYSFQRAQSSPNSPHTYQEQTNVRDICGRKYPAEIALRFAAGLNCFIWGSGLIKLTRRHKTGYALICSGLACFCLPIYSDCDRYYGGGCHNSPEPFLHANTVTPCGLVLSYSREYRRRQRQASKLYRSRFESRWLPQLRTNIFRLGHYRPASVIRIAWLHQSSRYRCFNRAWNTILSGRRAPARSSLSSLASAARQARAVSERAKRSCVCHATSGRAI